MALAADQLEVLVHEESRVVSYVWLARQLLCSGEEAKS